MKDRLGPWPETCKDPPNPPYEYVLRRFDNAIGAEGVLSIYEQAMADLRSCFGPAQNGGAAPDDHIPHNVALGKNWIIVIPRRNAGVGGAYGNTLSMLGMVSVATEEELECWLAQGPREVQSQLGIPRVTPVQNGAGDDATRGHINGQPISSPANDHLTGTQQGVKA